MPKLDFMKKLQMKQQANALKPYLINGDTFPVDINAFFPEAEPESHIYVCFTSLSCASCIQFLPVLREIAAQHAPHLLLCSDGTPEENAEIRSYFQFPFPVVETAGSHRLDRVPLPVTPYMFKLHAKDGSIASHDNVETYEQFLAL